MDFKLYVSSGSDSDYAESDSESKFEAELALPDGQLEVSAPYGSATGLKRNYEFSPESGCSGSDSDSVSEWEDVPLERAEDSFTVTLNKPQQEKASRRAESIEGRKKKVAVHQLGIVSYLLHGYLRNKWINDSVVQKKLRKILPKKLLKSSKSFWKAASMPSRGGSLENDLIYVLKYAVKWFRLNFRVNCNGLRVLGYVPSDKLELDYEAYYPPCSKPIDSLKAFASVAGKLQHNRDTGTQLFTCILRILGFETRLVFSLPLLPVTNNPSCTQPYVDLERLNRIKDNDLLYPYYWTEVVNPINKDEIFVIENISFHEEDKRFLKLKRYREKDDSTRLDLGQFYTPHFFPVVNSLNKMTMHYVVSLTEFNTIFETSSRYMPDVAHRWFKKLDLRTFSGRSALLFHTVLRILNKGSTKGINPLELEALEKISILNCTIPTTYSAMRRNPNVVTPSALRYNETIPASAKPLGYINIENRGKKEPVYFKSCIVAGKSEQQWRLLGRSIVTSEINSPIRTTKFQRPRTLLKRRRYNLNELNGQSSENDVKLFSYMQTCVYVPSEVTVDSDGTKRLPRNRYGNVEIFRPWMLPKDCIWLKLSKIREIFEACKKHDQIDFDYVPVVTGFNFNIRPGFAVPQFDGILVCKEFEVSAKRLWFSSIMNQKRKEIDVRNLRALKAWKLFMKALKIKERLDKYD